jgi:hypothetical protein
VNLTTEQRRALDGDCLACGTPLPADAGVRRLYCDRRCLRAFHGGDVVREPSTCQHCTRPLAADAHPLRRYCSQAHRQAAWIKRQAARRTCEQCGSDITGKARQARMCSDSCRDRARRARNREQDRAAARRRYAAQRVAS